MSRRLLGSFGFIPAVAVVFTACAPSAPPPAGARDSVSAGPTARGTEPGAPRLARGDLDVAGRAAVYAAVADANARRLPSLVDEALAISNEHTREFTLEAIFTRFAETDPERGVRIALARGLSHQGLLPLYRRWAEDDLEAVLDSIAGLESRPNAQAAARAVLDWLGPIEGIIELLSSRLTNIDRTDFLVQAIEIEAERSPYSALERALAVIDRRTRNRALQRVAGVWAEQSAEAALVEAERIADEEARRVFVDAVYRQLAATDPVALLEKVSSMDDQETQQRAFMQIVSRPMTAVDARRMIELSSRLSGPYAMAIRQRALMGWVESEPRAALEYVESLPLSMDRQRLLANVAQSFGRQDPDAALAWLESLDVRSAELDNAVYAGIAGRDPARAVDLIFASDQVGLVGRGASQMYPLLSSLASSTEVDRRGIADRIVSMSAPAAQQQFLGMFVQTWARSDPEGVMDWVIANGNRISLTAIPQIASAVAQRDPALAADMTQQIPAAARNQWIATVAQSYAQFDTQAALVWIEQFRGTPAYDQSILNVIQTRSQYDPAEAAALLSTISFDPEDRRLQQTITQLTAMWSQADPSGALDWVTRLPNGTNRDTALRMLVGNSNGEMLDAPILALFSTDEARQTAVSGAIQRVAMMDPERARNLMDRHVTDPTLRETIQQAIEQQKNANFGASFSRGFVYPAISVR